jgi:hypothetical protein
MRFREDQIEFDFATAKACEKFDAPDAHFLQHCMKAVDYILELTDRYIFLEIKDPQHPKARPAQVAEFIAELQSKVLIDEVLRPKCCDSLLYKLATQDIDLSKPIYYYILIALDTLGEPELLVLADNLRKKIPIVATGSKIAQKFIGAGKQPHFIQECAVFNLSTWNKSLSPLGATVRRILKP